MLEWLKRHAWKACSRLKRLTGSNPVLSAHQKKDKRESSLSALVLFLMCTAPPQAGRDVGAVKLRRNPERTYSPVPYVGAVHLRRNPERTHSPVPDVGAAKLRRNPERTLSLHA